MIRVISSPSSSTTGLATLIFATALLRPFGRLGTSPDNSTSVLDLPPAGTPGRRWREPVRARNRTGVDRNGVVRPGTGTDHPAADGLPQPVRVRHGLPDRVALVVGGAHPQPHCPGGVPQGRMGDRHLVHTVADPP